MQLKYRFYTSLNISTLFLLFSTENPRDDVYEDGGQSKEKKRTKEGIPLKMVNGKCPLSTQR